ncbi:MAG TPA: molybdopterin-binding protein [Stellaceae bacterium]|jgi:molybdenum cofactor synthesis domain-containing protein|nr:molybdopterin-binding protein [Stellaceae bacterium]
MTTENDQALRADHTAEKPVTACLIIIGNEILSGRTKDANLSFLAAALNDAGIKMSEARVIPDIEATIVATVNEMRVKYDYVFTTGGIGPTHDDITGPSVAKAFGVPLVLNEEARARLEARIKHPLNEARLRMAHVPKGATLVDNPVSAAPGFRIGNVFVLAGVPVIAQAMFQSLRPQLVGGARTMSRSIQCNLPEGAMAKDLEDIQNVWPQLDIGSYPVWISQGFAVNLVLRGTVEAQLARAGDEVVAMIVRLGGMVLEDVYS